MTLLVGIPACAFLARGRIEHGTPGRYCAAVLGGVGATPVIIPPMGEAALPILDRLDGLLLPGSPSNVEPHHYGAATSETPGDHDPARDTTTLPLIREAVRRRLPVLAICRGIQELNVALGGTLHQQVRLLPGHHDHRGHGETLDEQYAPVHEITAEPWLATVLGRDRTRVNSVHGQALDRVAPTLRVEARAPDGTIEAVRADTPGFAVGVQWHPEWRYAENPDSMALFRAFGDACRAHAAADRRHAA